MSGATTYRNYVENDAFATRYARYQRRYVRTCRESDRVLIETIRRLAGPRRGANAQLRVLDLGCSTGNLLLHLKHRVAGLRLFDAYIAERALDTCRRNPDLAGVTFMTMNLLEPDVTATFDVVIVNAVLISLDDAEFGRATRNIGALTRAGGWFLNFEWMHPFRQELAVHETSDDYPRGVTFRLRGYATVRAALASAGFAAPRFMPFDIPIDLARRRAPDDLTSHTTATADGARLCFRGALFQPWCHLVARKKVGFRGGRPDGTC